MTRRLPALLAALALTACAEAAALPDSVGPTASEAPPADAPAVLEDVRLAGHDGYDRLTFQFRGDAVPGFDVGYAPQPITADPEGGDIEVAGEAVLAVRLAPASGADLHDGYEQVYVGPQRLESDTTAVTEAVLTGDFEAVLGWAVGTRAEAPFRVSVQDDPVRVVVDVAHP
jgi:hypothetical protein